MYDILIIGGGVIGCFIARELAKYQAKIILLEKNNDVCSETSNANSAIIHSGYDPLPNTLKARLNVLSNPLFDQVCKDLDVSFIRNGSLTIALNEEEVETLYELKERAKVNGVEVEILDKEEVLKREPNLSDKVLKALYAPTCAIINPFELTIGLMENAMDNGVELALNSKVVAIAYKDNYFTVTCKNNKTYQTKTIINAAGVYADEVAALINDTSFKIKARKGSYFVLDHFDNNFVKHTLFRVPTSKGKGVVITPTTHYNYLIGPSSDFIDAKDDTSTEKEVLDAVKERANSIIEKIPYNQVIRTFSGLRAVSNTDDFIIDYSIVNKQFINVAGIQSPGLAASCGIANMVRDLVLKLHPYEMNPKFNPKRRKMIKLSRMSLEERNNLIKENPTFGRIVCRCEKVSEGEIIDCIRRNAGANSVKGVKKRVRPGFGKCQGTFCQPHVVKILARELNIKEHEVVYDNLGSYLIKYQTKLGEKSED